jgi:glutathione S-transferase
MGTQHLADSVRKPTFFFHFHSEFLFRFILNYKRLPYSTVWVEFPDVETTLRSIGAPPSATRSDGRPIYTLPVIVDPMRSPMSPEVLCNTNTIAEYLEATYPARPVFPEGSRALQTLFVHYIQEVFAKPLLPIMVPLSHQRLPERSQSHFRGHRGAAPGYPGAGMSTPTPDYTLATGPQREQAWRAVKEQFDFLAMILDKNNGDGDGIVAMGHDVTYADFALCSVLIWIERVAAHDGWARIRHWNSGRWNRLWDKCKDYMDEC